MGNVRPLIRGILILDDGLPVPFMYNPNEIGEKRSVQYEEKNALGYSHPRLHYRFGKGRDITWTMSVRDFMEVGGLKFPFLAEIFIESLYDLTYPIYEDGVMIEAPPTLYFVFGPFVRPMKIIDINTTMIKWDPILLLKHAEITLTTKEDVTETKQRINSFRALGNLL